MPIAFNPPDWLIQEYVNRKSPIEEASQGVQSALQTYLQQRVQQEQMQRQQQNESLGTYIKAFEAGGPDLASQVAQRINYTNPPALPGRTVTQVGPGGTAGIVNPPSVAQAAPPASTMNGFQMTPNEMSAQQSIPSEHQSSGSPVIDMWNKMRGQSSQRQTPVGLQPDMAQQFQEFGNQGKYGERQRNNLMAQATFAKSMKDLEADPNAPVPVMTRDQAIKAGQVSPKTKILDDGTNQDSRFATQQGSTLRGQFIKDSEEFQTYGKRLQTVIASAKRPDAAGDISMLYSYMKMLDPNSAVREGELAIGASAGSLPQNLVATYNKAVNGQRMSPEIRQQFVDRAKEIYRTQAGIQKNLEGTYTRTAAAIPGVDPKQVIIDYSVPVEDQMQMPNAPQVGEARQGYVFQGGDPSNPASWRKQ